MIRVFNVTRPIVCGEPTEFDIESDIPFGMMLHYVKTTFRREEGILYLSIKTPELCESLDVSVLSDVRFHNSIYKGKEITIHGVYTGRYTRDMHGGCSIDMSIGFIGEVRPEFDEAYFKRVKEMLLG
jgi:hypothetical protein